VAVNGRSGESAAAVAATIGGAVAAPFDVTDEGAVVAGVAALGPVDVLVANVGMAIRKPLEQLALDEWRRLVDANLTSAFLVARAVAPAMIERGRGKIVTVCSVTSELARENGAAYAATKGGLKMLTRGMCADWARHGIQANALAPGWFRTDLTGPLAADPAFDAWLRARVPAGRWGEPDELVGAAVFLASAASDFVNGQVLYVDGGVSAVV
jgi:gluconate 5-dehydrogenase